MRVNTSWRARGFSNACRPAHNLCSANLRVDAGRKRMNSGETSRPVPRHTRDTQRRNARNTLWFEMHRWFCDLGYSSIRAVSGHLCNDPASGLTSITVADRVVYAACFDATDNHQRDQCSARPHDEFGYSAAGRPTVVGDYIVQHCKSHLAFANAGERAVALRSGHPNMSWLCVGLLTSCFPRHMA